MRQILFRGKRTDNGEWVYGYYTPFVCEVVGGDHPRYEVRRFIYAIDDQGLPSREDAENCIEVIRESVGQFTGQKDSKLTDIYEGDILQYSYERDKSGTDIIEYTELVEWEELKGMVGFSIHRDMDREIIGNITDNPELLKP